MARRTGLGATTLSGAASGERLPSLRVVLAYVRACGGDPLEWEERWRRAVREVASEPVVDEAAESPYRGLGRFEPGDRELFFGRDEIIARLAADVLAHRFVAVVGASGSGKSSLLRAGLIPVLQTEREPGRRPAAIRILTPGPHPLATALTPHDGEGDTVIVVDQFEELFTLCTDPQERAGFLDLLLTAVEPGSRLRVVIAVRADFFARCAEHHRLAAALRNATLVVGPMSPAELRDTIIKPAAACGLIVERTLTARIIQETAEEPGSLPLMSHALLETWRRRRGRALTEEMYDAAGGIQGAVAATAEQLYTSLSPSEAQTARRILLRLVTPGEGTQDTRRPAPRTELDSAAAETGHVLEQLVTTRLLTLDGDIVDLAHEALLTAWPRYQAWIEEDRERLRIHRRLTEATHTWHNLNRDPGALYRGTRLATTEDTFPPEERDSLTDLERAFLTASITTHEQEKRAAARTTRRLRQFAAALSILLVLAITAGAIAWTLEKKAVAAQQVDLSSQLAAQSNTLLTSNVATASLLAIQAYRIHHTAAAISSLDNAAAFPLQGTFIVRKGVNAMVFSPDGRILAVASSDGVELRDMATGKILRTTAITGGAHSVVFSPDGRILAVASSDGVELRDMATGKILRTIGDASAPMTFSPDGHTLAASDGGDNTRVRLWSMATGRTLHIILGYGHTINSIAFSPDERTLAIGSQNGAELADATTGEIQRDIPSTEFNGVNSMEFSPDGNTLATGGYYNGSPAQLWSVASGECIATYSNTGGPNLVAFSPDGHALAIGGANGVQLSDGSQLADAATGQPQTTLTTTGSVNAMVFSPDGRTLATSDDTGTATGTVQLWNTAVGQEARATLPGTSNGSMAFSPDGSILATSGLGSNVQLWNTTTGYPRTLPIASNGMYFSESSSPTGPVPPLPPILGPVAFSPDGRTLATATSEDDKVRLWDTATGHARNILTTDGTVFDVEISPDGRALATRSSGPDGHVYTFQLWGLATGKVLRTLTNSKGIPVFSPNGGTLALFAQGHDNAHTVQMWSTSSGKALHSFTVSNSVDEVTFSPDGHLLATSGSDTETVQLRNPITGKILRTLTADGPVQFLAFSPDGKLIATAGGNGIQLWNAATGQVHIVPPSGSTKAVVFSPDGHTLATIGASVQLWDVATGALRTTLVNSQFVKEVAFSPDGHTLATEDNQQTLEDEGNSVRLWEVTAQPTPDAAIRKICKTVHRNLTPQEWSLYLPGQPHNPICHP